MASQQENIFDVSSDVLDVDALKSISVNAKEEESSNLEERFNIAICKRYKHYWFLKIYFSYLLGGIVSAKEFLFIDEAQDLSPIKWQCQIHIQLFVIVSPNL